jgi:hypothetical protein
MVVLAALLGFILGNKFSFVAFMGYGMASTNIVA